MFKFGKKKRVKEEKMKMDETFKNLIENFDETAYLDANPDIKTGIKNGQFQDALHHLETFGLNEIEHGDRKFHKDFEPFNESIYFKLFTEIKESIGNGDFNSGFEHFCANGYVEIISKTRSWKMSFDINEKQEQQFKTRITEVDNLEEEDLNIYQTILDSNLDWSEYKLNNNHSFVSSDPIIDYMKNWKKHEPLISNFFDTNFYLEIYPDIKKSNMNPLLHYLTLGEKEGRKALFNEENILKGKLEYSTEKETIIFVSHESSASGAPLLGYNIADQLIKKYNIVHIIVRKSNIHESFLENCDLMYYGIENNTYGDAYIFMKRMLKNREIKAIVGNSVVTSQVLLAAHTLNIPSLLLIHEFTDYIKPVTTVMNAVIVSDQVIVPATIIQDSIQEEFKKYSNNKTILGNIHIIPQGKIPSIPEQYGENDSIEKLCRKLHINSQGDAKIIVGAGFVQIRKGVDLFIATAKYIKENFQGKCKFVWVGDGFDPENDLSYSVWLEKEINLSGLEDDFIFLEHQKNLDTIFSMSDVFCLTSRMDPFPNVVIDALDHDLHIACFENASGSSEFLEKYNANCTIVGYMDTYKLAEGIIQHFECGKNMIGVNRDLLTLHLNFDTYVQEVDNLISESIRFKDNSQVIIDTLIDSGEFDANYFGGEGNIEKHCRNYVETSLKGIRLQNPKPGFSQSKWLHEYSANNPYVVPLYEALLTKQTTTHEVEIVPYRTNETIDFFYAVHLHLFYADLADEFATYFKKLPGKYDILITIVKEEDRETAIKAFSVCDANEVKIVVVENIGRDSGPLFFGLKNIVLTGDYEVIGHFHSKKSFDINDDIGNQWRKFLTETLIGDEEVAKSVIGLFNDPEVGLVFPDDSHIVDMGENREYIDSLCEMMNLPIMDETAIFPLGNMFWARIEAIKELFELDPKMVLQEEPLPYDGSYMHAIERITPHLVKKNSYRYTTVYKKGEKW